jgi:hypothetical protein
MLTGSFVWQVGLFERVWRRRRHLVYLFAISVVIGLADMALSEIVIPSAQGGDPDVRISILEAVKPFLSILAPAGRTAFTNYVLQSALPFVLFPLLFGWWLPGITPAETALKVTVVFIILVLFSTWWLKRFRFGPFEWHWRSLTYWKLQPMRGRTSSPTT